MSDKLIPDLEMEFQLYDVLRADKLCEHNQFEEQIKIHFQLS